MTAAPAWEEAALAAAVLAVDPVGLGGAAVRARPGPAREAWIARLTALLPAAAPVRRMPLHIDDDRLLGGLDLPATLRAGRPMAQAGLLAEAHGGLLLLPMAERLSAGTAARLCAVLDCGQVTAEREGLALRAPARLAMVALDEGEGDEETAPAALRDRLALHVTLDGLRPQALPPAPAAAVMEAARRRLAVATVPGGIVDALCAAAVALGIPSLRASLLAVRAARAAAALAGRVTVTEEDAALAARLVLAPRATQVPQEAPQPEQTKETHDPPPSPPAEAEPEAEAEEPDGGETGDRPAEEVVLDAALAALPPHLLADLARRAAGRTPSTPGRSGTAGRTTGPGRPVGVRPGPLPRGARLALVDTLRAAAPWQRLREAAPGRLAVRAEDLRHTRVMRRAESCTVFVVDASGSAALHRLAEAKGAVERLLADCYVRRDRVALIAFRGRGADLLLPPTRSLTRARRALAGLPGGGGTPLAAALAAADTLAAGLARRGETPTLVLLTDGRANVCRDGTGGRARAAREAEAAAQGLRTTRTAALVIDTAVRPEPRAQALAEALGGRYLALPQADAAAISGAVRTTADAGRGGGHAVSA